MAGPPPQPTERRRARGNPGKRALPVPVATILPLPARTAVPGHLGVAGAALWSTALSACEGWLGVGDQATVLLLAEAADRRADLLERLASDGWVLRTEKGYAYAHPAAGMLTALEAQMTRWLSALGLTPTDRARLGLVEVRRVSKLDDLRQRRRPVE